MPSGLTVMLRATSRMMQLALNEVYMKCGVRSAVFREFGLILICRQQYFCHYNVRMLDFNCSRYTIFANLANCGLLYLSQYRCYPYTFLRIDRPAREPQNRSIQWPQDATDRHRTLFLVI